MKISRSPHRIMGTKWYKTKTWATNRGRHRLPSFLRSTILFVFGVGVQLQALSASEPLVTPGILIRGVESGTAIERAGIRPNDLIVFWKPVNEKKSLVAHSENLFQSPFDWDWLILSQVPRGPISLGGKRGDEAISFIVEPGTWDCIAQPVLSQDLQKSLDQALSHVQQGDIDTGLAIWKGLAQEAEHGGNPGLASWLLFHLGNSLAKARKWERAQEAFISGLPVAPSPIATSLLWSGLGKAYLEQGLWSEAEDAFKKALQIWERLNAESLATASGHHFLGEILLRQGKLDEANVRLERAYAIKEKQAPESLSMTLTLISLGRLAYQRGQIEVAQHYYERSLAIREKRAPDTLMLATNLIGLANVASDRHDFAKADRLYHRALEIRERLAPESLIIADTLNDLSVNATRQGNVELARSLLSRALSIHEKLHAENIQLSHILLNLGNLNRSLGSQEDAARLIERAMMIAERVAPGSLQVANTLDALGSLAYESGDGEMAESYYWRCLEIRERIMPNSLLTAEILNNIAGILSLRGEQDLALAFYRRSSRIDERIDPRSLSLARSLCNIGSIYHETSQYDMALEFYGRAIKIAGALNPKGLDYAEMLVNLGNVYGSKGSFQKAGSLYHQALRLFRSLAPNGFYVSNCLQNLGELALKTHDLETARGYFQEALEIRRAVTPWRMDRAQSAHALGLTYRDLGRIDLAELYFQEALTALDTEIDKSMRNRAAGNWLTEQYGQFYRDTIELLIAKGQTDEAFHVLERSRARSFLALLEERKLSFHTELSDEIERRRRRLAAKFDSLQQDILEADARGNHALKKRLLNELHRAWQSYNEVTTEVRRASPRLAALQYPKPLDTSGVRAELDPGTLLLSYSVGKTITHIFILAPGRPLEVAAIALGNAAFREQVETLRGLIPEARPGTPLGHAETQTWAKLSRQLYSELLSPAREALKQSKRILIIPDGPLHLIPWNALICDQSNESGESFYYLGEWRPIHIAVSASVFAELKSTRRNHLLTTLSSLTMFGDPSYPPWLAVKRAGRDIADVRVRATADRGFGFAPLPATRNEVQRISSLFAESQVYLGNEATEERAKSLPQDTRLIHFAAHGTLDERFPLNSAVVLSIPEKFEEGKENGLLQAWEIFEQVRLDADLVVLSACESGLGKEMGGEGLIGLTRAFQYAGARSVMASLWKISDRTTAELMVRFYKHLKEGLPKDEALRAAQMELIHGPIQVKNEKGEVEEIDASAPYYWAAFQIYGDWQ